MKDDLFAYYLRDLVNLAFTLISLLNSKLDETIYFFS
jgi:hypothetical protein